MGKISVAKDWDETTFLDAASSFQLVYLFSSKPIEFTHSSIQLVDTKITFSKELNESKSQTNIYPYFGGLNEHLLSLSFQSGVYSRFRTDNRLNRNEFQKLYQVWIEKALEKGMVYTDRDLNAMVTLSVDQGVASIGLLAVNEKEREKGLARQLVLAAENRAIHLGADRMLINTQEQNIAACNLYKSMGYEVAERVFIYHYYNTASLR